MKILISVLFGITCGCISLCICIIVRFYLFLRDFDQLVYKHNLLADDYLRDKKNENNK